MRPVRANWYRCPAAWCGSLPRRRGASLAPSQQVSKEALQGPRTGAVCALHLCGCLADQIDLSKREHHLGTVVLLNRRHSSCPSAALCGFLEALAVPKTPQIQVSLLAGGHRPVVPPRPPHGMAVGRATSSYSSTSVFWPRLPPLVKRNALFSGCSPKQAQQEHPGLCTPPPPIPLTSRGVT